MVSRECPRNLTIPRNRTEVKGETGFERARMTWLIRLKFRADRNGSNSPRCLGTPPCGADPSARRSEGFPTSATIVCGNRPRAQGSSICPGIGGVQKPLLSSPRGGESFPSGSWLAEVDRLGPIDGKTGHCYH